MGRARTSSACSADAPLARGRIAIVAAALALASTAIAAAGLALTSTAVAAARLALASVAIAAATLALASTPFAAAAESAAEAPAVAGEAGSRRSPIGREPCARRDPLRQPFFGDLHVHTALSLDAATQGTQARPRDAYRFARGERLGIQPFARDGRALRHVQLRRPLDFAAVTDHAELFGEREVCSDDALAGHDSALCRIYRRWPRLSFFLMNYRASAADGRARFRFCGPDGERCVAAAASPWAEVQQAAEEAYDRTSACAFTTFVGYEWTASPGSNNLHRNVIFASEVVPALPISAFEAPEAEILWHSLAAQCRKGLPGCDFVSIPHNSNLSGGLMFRTTDASGAPMDAAAAAARAAAEPLAEVMQHKGASECRTGLGNEDELCDFELLAYDNFGGRYASWLRRPPGASNYLRNVLGEGLLVEERTGVNPFRLGLVGGTDTHLGAAGAVSERGYPGHGGAGAPVSGAGPAGFSDDLDFNPGGLTVLWAEENSRESLFAALSRREAYATSGPRIAVRFFGGFDLPDDLCRRADLAAIGYQRGVPMGGVLAPPGDAAARPRFVVSALRDAGVEEEPGAPLERIQIVKGWVEGGTAHERVVDVAGGAGGASVDPATCETSGAGFEDLCAVWTDEQWVPGQRAFYYARVVETPTCRWTGRACRDARVRCDDPATIPAAFSACCDGSIALTSQERAWTSPIWVSPAGR